MYGHPTADIKLEMTNISDLVSDIIFNKYKIRDPYYWPEKISNSFREYCTQKGPEFFQNKNDDFKQSARLYDHKRLFTASMFKRTLPNGEIGDRKWVMYSIKQGSIYCFMCKLFSSRLNSLFVSKGFDNWKKYEKLS
ncbi:zinc finger MYM-type protein 5-like [Sipha flava]|uniref:Zinc finger MYM-type protein 5-like n=2 Tax=Sipha flava TaxID=143950 RepID=A0A8B8F2B7_9HEMI|nr:zinc finger MYM-type protein 5-like [Sipha flava]